MTVEIEPSPALLIVLANMGPKGSSEKALRKCRERMEKARISLRAPFGPRPVGKADAARQQALGALGALCATCGKCEGA